MPFSASVVAVCLYRQWDAFFDYSDEVRTLHVSFWHKRDHTFRPHLCIVPSDTNEFRHSIPIGPRPPQTASGSLQTAQSKVLRTNGTLWLSRFPPEHFTIGISRYTTT